MLFNPVAIKLINLILKDNQGSRTHLAKYSAKSFKLIFPGFSISALCNADGYLVIHNTSDLDVVINIPLDSVTFLIDKDKLAVYKKISFIGDKKFGREVLEILSKLHLDGIYTKVNSPFMLIALNKFTDLIKFITNYIKHLSANSGNTLKEYLMYETQDIITRFDNDHFCHEVDEIKKRSEHLEQQIKKLKINKAASILGQIGVPMKQRVKGTRPSPTSGRQ
jgi:ubiquinone biosynthesis protein UbiJ